MPIRDVILFVSIFSTLPFIFKRPFIGVLVCAWLGYMNPHRYSWGPAYYFPFVALVSGITIFSFIFSKENKKLPKNIITAILLILVIWVSITTMTALNHDGAVFEWKRFVKIQILNALALYMFQSRERINYLVAVIVASIGFYAFKGGIFTITTGGVYMVSGPERSFISGNTEIGFASTVILPLMFYLWTLLKKKWHKNVLIAVMILSAIGIIGTQSRGAFLAFGVLCIYFWWVSKKKMLVLVLLVCVLPVLFSLMPDQYFEKMETIETYKEDASAMGRINAWWFAYNLSKDRPILGGGANTFTPQLFKIYAPEPDNFHDVHSIYFEMLGEQGYPGLLIFLSMLYFSYRNCVMVRRVTKERFDLKWAYDLARMLQASFVAYIVGGGFLGLAYFDLLYHLVSLTALLRLVVDRELVSGEEDVPSLGVAKAAAG